MCKGATKVQVFVILGFIMGLIFLLFLIGYSMDVLNVDLGEWLE